MRERESPGAPPPAFWLLVRGLFALGLFSRVAPLAHVQGRVFWQWPTEDGYLMMTIARNLAMGNGFSTADGSIPTNGTQPGTTLLQAGVFWLVGGDRFWGVWLIQVLLVGCSVAAAVLLARLAERILDGSPYRATAPWLLAAVWFASPVFVQHTMNCLETGPYALVVILVAGAFAESRAEARTPWPIGRCLRVGLLLGVAFWVRNDSIFLILGACLAYVWSGYAAGGLALARAHFGRTLIFGSTSVLVASPWLVFNQTRFGHIMPVSGRAESLTAHTGDNLPITGPQLLEGILAVVPIPRWIEQQPVVVALGFALVLAYIAFAARVVWPRSGERGRRVMVVAAIFIPCLWVFYGFFFGAGWFIPRYFFPFSPLLMLVWGPTVVEGARRLGRPRTVKAAAGALVAIHAGVLALQYRAGKDHPHEPIVEWVRANVPEDTWVAAVQTGTLNFFHPRTLNLDGKVNVAAYEALAAGREQEYLLSQTHVKYLVDWHDAVVDWAGTPELSGHFQLVEADEARNLGAARRIEGGTADDE